MGEGGPCARVRFPRRNKGWFGASRPRAGVAATPRWFALEGKRPLRRLGTGLVGCTDGLCTLVVALDGSRDGLAMAWVVESPSHHAPCTVLGREEIEDVASLSFRLIKPF